MGRHRQLQNHQLIPALVHQDPLHCEHHQILREAKVMGSVNHVRQRLALEWAKARVMD
jgi:hypothetical protein